MDSVKQDSILEVLHQIKFDYDAAIREETAARMTYDTTNNEDNKTALEEAQRAVKALEVRRKELIDMLILSPASISDAHNHKVSHENHMATIRLAAPKVFTLDGTVEFQTFILQAENFFQDETFPQWVRILKTLLSPEAFKLAQPVLDTATDWQSLVTALTEVLGQPSNLVTDIHEFLNCKKRPNETLQQYANRLRLTATRAYPNSPPSNHEPFLIQRFIASIGLGRAEKNIMLSLQPDSLGKAVNVA